MANCPPNWQSYSVSTQPNGTVAIAPFAGHPVADIAHRKAITWIMVHVPKHVVKQPSPDRVPRHLPEVTHGRRQLATVPEAVGRCPLLIDPCLAPVVRAPDPAV